MEINFINSERCKIGDEELIFFTDINKLGDELIEIIEEVGAENFLSSPKENIKKARESFAEYFFTLGCKKGTGQDWFLMQPKDDPPDFVLINVSDNPIIITLGKFELVEVPPRCKTTEEMIGIVRSKLNNKYAGCHLLIFINHEKSKEWIKVLHEQIKDFSPFKTIWTVYLVWCKDKNELYGSVINQLWPDLSKSIEVALNDEILRQNFKLPDYMEELKIDGKTFISFKKDFIEELTMAMRKSLLAKSRAKNECHQ